MVLEPGVAYHEDDQSVQALGWDLTARQLAFPPLECHGWRPVPSAEFFAGWKAQSSVEAVEWCDQSLHQKYEWNSNFQKEPGFGLSESVYHPFVEPLNR